MTPTITTDYVATDPRHNLYTLTIDERANELRNAVCSYGLTNGQPDDAYLLARGMLVCILDRVESVSISHPEYELIQTVQAWAQSVIDEYRTNNAQEIAEYRKNEGKDLTDAEVLGYATN